MAKDCIFCKIIANEIPSPRVYEDERFICIRDIQPQAKVHWLVIPKTHVASLDAAFPESGNASANEALLGEMMHVATRVAREEGLLPDGFRTVINTNQNGGQTVFHIHMHVLGGQPLKGTFS